MRAMSSRRLLLHQPADAQPDMVYKLLFLLIISSRPYNISGIFYFKRNYSKKKCCFSNGTGFYP
jgi:hypothetical protein